ncbi:MAG: hypothetical protein JG759_402 [Thermoanaerobacter sp.]|jgi:hypothetical protein|nr:hypothetical protein [Thermoanaerobacter sp.]
MKLIPSTGVLKDLGVTAVGGVAGQLANSMLKDKVSFFAGKEWLADVSVVALGYLVMQVKGFNKVGTGMAVVGMANLINTGIDLVQEKF